MASLAVVCCSLITLVFFIVQTVGVATRHWFKVEVLGTATISVGLFQMCLEFHAAALSAANQCIVYSNYATINFNYYATTGLNVIGCILLFAGVIVGLVGGCSSTRPGRTTVQKMSAILFFSAGCTIAAVVWFYITQYHSSKSLLALLGSSITEIELGYSFYVVALAGGATLVAAITMSVTASRMDVPQTVAAPFGAPAGTQMFAMQSVPQQGPTGYPQTGYPQPVYPQTGAGYGGQQFAPMANAPPPKY